MVAISVWTMQIGEEVYLFFVCQGLHCSTQKNAKEHVSVVVTGLFEVVYGTHNWMTQLRQESGRSERA